MKAKNAFTKKKNKNKLVNWKSERRETNLCMKIRFLSYI